MIELNPILFFSLGLLACGALAILGFFAIEFLDNRPRSSERLPPAE